MRVRLKRWEDCLKEDMQIVGLKENDSQDCKLWRERILTGDLT